jgi:Protein of unknown function (DUF669)
MKYTPGEPGVSHLPNGEYDFECTNAEETVSDSSGEDMIEVTIKIKNGPTVYDYLLSTEKSKWKLTNFLAAIGQEVKPFQEVDVDPNSFIGGKGKCYLYVDEWQGKKKNKVGDYLFTPPASGSNPPPAKDSWR